MFYLHMDLRQYCFEIVELSKDMYMFSKQMLKFVCIIKANLQFCRHPGVGDEGLCLLVFVGEG